MTHSMIKVVFQNGLIGLEGDLVEKDGTELFIKASKEITSLNFVLEGGGAFLTNPVQWVLGSDTKVPLDGPDKVSMTQRTDAGFTLEIQPDKEAGVYPFFLLMLYENHIYSRDPVLLTEGDPTDPDIDKPFRGQPWRKPSIP